MVNRSCETGADRHLDVWRRALYRLYSGASNRQHAENATRTTRGQFETLRESGCVAARRSFVASSLLTHRTGNGMNHRLQAALAAVLGGAALLAGCSTRTDVSLTGNTPAQYSHVWVTVQEVWFNGSATAGPDDSGWNKYPLSTPSTVDLVAENGGNLGSIASGLRIPASTYSQVRLIPVDATAPLAASAQNAGAIYNFEADYVDSNGNTQQLQLELLNPDKGIGIQTSLKVPFGTTGSGLIPIGTNTSTTSVSTTSAIGNTSTTPSNSFAAALDGTVNLVPFHFASSSNGILWSAHATAAYDLSIAGGISGQLR